MNGKIHQNTKGKVAYNVVFSGYAMSSGIYFNDGVTYFAIGAPRQDLVGAVSSTSIKSITLDKFCF